MHNGRMNGALVQVYFALLLAGVVLITLELFIPGGVVGSIGAIALVVAAGIALHAFEGVLGVVASVGSFVLAVVAIVLWMKVFPKTRIGRILTVSTDLRGAQSAATDLAELVGRTGKAASALRPGGFAVVGGRRVDVVTRGEMISAGTPVRVLRVEGSRVLVEASTDSTPEAEGTP